MCDVSAKFRIYKHEFSEVKRVIAIFCILIIREILLKYTSHHIRKKKKKIEFFI